MMTTGTFISRLNHGTRMPCSDGFGQSAGSGMNCQWFETSEEID